MRTMMTWAWVILAMGMTLSDVLSSWEWWVAPAQVAGEGALAQEPRPATSPMLRSRFVRPVPPGWTAPSLVEAQDRPDEPWRTGWAQLGLPGAALGPRLGVGPAGEAVPSVGCDAGARLGPPPLAASVRRALPPPQVSLVKDVREAMPQRCDDKLFGKEWQCNIACYTGGMCRGSFSLTFSRSYDADGYQRIRMTRVGRGTLEREWTVDRKYRPANPTHEIGYLETKEKLVYVTCNERTSGEGYKTFAVYFKKADGSEREMCEYYVDREENLRMKCYLVWWKKGSDGLTRRHRRRKYEGKGRRCRWDLEWW